LRGAPGLLPQDHRPNLINRKGLMRGQPTAGRPDQEGGWGPVEGLEARRRIGAR
jgi:hypothetical protein